MGKIYSFCNQKGGVGKTTTAVNLSACLGKLGLKVLLIDMDPQGNATSGLGLDKNAITKTVYQSIIDEISMTEILIPECYTNVSIIPSNSDLAGAEIELINEYGREFILKNRLKDIQESYDIIFIDCPPSLGLLTINALAASDGIIIPLQCEYYAMEGLGQLLKTYNLIKDKLNPSLEISGVVLTMADFRTNLTQQVIEEVRKHFGDNVFQTVIPRSVKISEAPSYGKPIIEYDANSRGSIAYTQLAEEFTRKFSLKQKVCEEKNDVPAHEEIVIDENKS